MLGSFLFAKLLCSAAVGLILSPAVAFAILIMEIVSMKLEEQLVMWENYFAEADKKNKKPYDSMKITTGDINYNIKQFNKHMGSGNDNNNPSTAEAQAREAAKAANKAVGAINAAMPDGSAGVGLGTGASGGASDGGASGGGEGGGCCESINKTADIQLDETLGWYINCWD